MCCMRSGSFESTNDLHHHRKAMHINHALRRQREISLSVWWLYHGPKSWIFGRFDLKAKPHEKQADGRQSRQNDGKKQIRVA